MATARTRALRRRRRRIIRACASVALGALGVGVFAASWLNGASWLPMTARAPVPSAPAAAPAPPGMVWIPAGTFVMGSSDARDPANEHPARTVHVDGFWMDEHHVTNAAFRAFVAATGYITTAERPRDPEALKTQSPPVTVPPGDSALAPGSLVFTPTKRRVSMADETQWWRWTAGADWWHPAGPGSSLAGKDDHPVVHVSFDDAVAYARWIGKRLPTEAEWEYAARGGLHRQRYAWGNEFMPGGRHMANTWQGWFPALDSADDGFVGTAPVRSFPPNGYGLYDMAGNAWQWSSDRFEASGDRIVVKGGSFLCSPVFCAGYRPSARQPSDPRSSASHLGFRLVKSPDGAGQGMRAATIFGRREAP